MNTRLSLTLTALLAAVCCLAPSTPAAKDVTVAITVDITYVWDPDNLFGGLDPDLHELTGTYTFDTETPDSAPESELGSYLHDVPPYGMTLTDTLGNKYEVTEGGAIEVAVVNLGGTYAVDQYTVEARPPNDSETGSSVTLNGIPVDMSFMRWTLQDGSGLAVEDDGLPMGAPNLTEWDNNRFKIELPLGPGPADTNMVSGTVTYAAVVTEDPLEALLAALDEVAAAGTAFDAEQEKGLFQKIHQVAVKVASGRVYQACQELQAFLCQLEALRDQTTDLAAVDELLALAHEVLADIPCPEDFAQCPILK